MPVGCKRNTAITNRSSTSSVPAWGLGPGTRHKTADLGFASLFVRPHDSWPKTIGLRYKGGVRHINPFSVKAHTVVALMCIPVHIFDTDTVGKRAAQAFPTRELIELLLERRVCKLPVVTSR